MPTDQILTLLVQERDKIDRAIAALQGTPRTGTSRKTDTPAAEATPTTSHAPKRRWSAAMKRKASERSLAMWAAKRRKAATKKG
jgi:hypothetical protein